MSKQIVIFLKRYWVFILLAVVISGLVMLRLSQRGQPPPSAPQPTPIPHPTLTKPKISGIEIPLNTKLSVADFSFPSRLKTYRGQEAMFSLPQSTKIAREFKFSGSPRKSEDVFLGTLYSWSSKTHFLLVSSGSNSIKYGLNLSQAQPPPEGTLPSPETAKSSLEELLAKLDLASDFEPKWQKEEYLVKGYSFPPVTNPEEADFIKVGFNPGIGQYQLVGLNPNEPLVSLILGKGGEIIRFQYEIYFSNFEGQEIHNLKTEMDVRATLTNEGKIVYAGTYRKSVKEPEITQAEFNQIRLTYLQEPEKSVVIQPIYILSGRGILASGEETEIIAYLPAIKFEEQTPLRLPGFLK